MKVIHIKLGNIFKVKNAIIMSKSEEYFRYIFYYNYKIHNTNSFARFEKDSYITEKYYVINGQYVGDDELSFKSFKQKAKTYLRHNKLKVFL